MVGWLENPLVDHDFSFYNWVTDDPKPMAKAVWPAWCVASSRTDQNGFPSQAPNCGLRLGRSNFMRWLGKNCRSLCREAKVPCPWTFFTWCWERMHSLQWPTEPCSTTPMMRWRRSSSRVRRATLQFSSMWYVRLDDRWWQCMFA